MAPLGQRQWIRHSPGWRAFQNEIALRAAGEQPPRESARRRPSAPEKSFLPRTRTQGRREGQESVLSGQWREQRPAVKVAKAVTCTEARRTATRGRTARSD